MPLVPPMITAKQTWQPATIEAITRDEALMSELHILGTPGMVYWDDQHKPRIFAGMPDSEQLRMMVGSVDHSTAPGCLRWFAEHSRICVAGVVSSPDYQRVDSGYSSIGAA